MRLLRHRGIYRSDGSFLLVNLGRVPPPVSRPRSQGIGRDGRRTPCPSFTMSSGRLFLDRDGRHQSSSPLRRQRQHKTIARSNGTIYHRTVTSVLTGCLSRGVHPIGPETSSHRARSLLSFPANVTGTLMRAKMPSKMQ
jgi:hypothetical protein